MKKRYIFTFVIPLVLAAIIAWIMTPNVEQTFMTKLSNYEKQDNVYNEVKLSFKFMDLQDMTQRIEQYKSDGEYYAKYYQFQTIPVLVNTSEDEVKFGNAYMATLAPIELSKGEKSLFWFDKLTTADIKKKSVTRDKEAEGDVYNAQLNDDTNIKVTFERGVLIRIEYEDIEYSNQVVNVVPIPSITQNKGKVVVQVGNYRYDAQPSDDFKFSSKAVKISVDELKKSMQTNGVDYSGLDEAFSQLKGAMKGLQEGLDEEEEDDSEYEEEEEEDSPHEGHHDFEEIDEVDF